MDSVVLFSGSGERNDLVDIPLVLVSPNVFTELIGLEFVVDEPSLAHRTTPPNKAKTEKSEQSEQTA
jgi:hypothetical protein